jgi:hypothetical protein
MHTADCMPESLESPHAHKRRLSGPDLANEKNFRHSEGLPSQVHPPAVGNRNRLPAAGFAEKSLPWRASRVKLVTAKYILTKIAHILSRPQPICWHLKESFFQRIRQHTNLEHTNAVD